MKTTKTTRTLDAYEKFLRNVWSRQNNGKFVSEYKYKQYVKETSRVLGLPEQYFLNAQLSQLEKWEKELRDKPLFGKDPKKLRNNLRSGFNAFINYCRFQDGLVTF